MKRLLDRFLSPSDVIRVNSSIKFGGRLFTVRSIEEGNRTVKCYLQDNGYIVVYFNNQNEKESFIEVLRYYPRSVIEVETLGLKWKHRDTFIDKFF